MRRRPASSKPQKTIDKVASVNSNVQKRRRRKTRMPSKWWHFGQTLVLICGIVVCGTWLVRNDRRRGAVSSWLRSSDASRHALLLFSRPGTKTVQTPRTRIRKRKKKMKPHYGTLDISFRNHNHSQRVIQFDLEVLEPNLLAKRQVGSVSNTDDTPPSCRATQLKSLYHRPNCNMLQELGFDSLLRQNNSRLLGTGTFVQAFSVSNALEVVAFKAGFLDDCDDTQDLERKIAATRQDSIVAAAVGPHPLVVNNYAYCGTVMLSEFEKHGTLEYVFLAQGYGCREQQSFPNHLGNNLTMSNKLRYSLDMAEALSLLHNHRDGSIVHNDLWSSQFLLNRNGKIKLNDFNLARFLLYDEEQNEYCNFQQKSGQYDVALEEVNGVRSGTERDIYRFGNVLYYVCTGWDLYPEVCGNDNKKYEMLKNGLQSPFPHWWQEEQDPSVFALEKEFAHLIQKCWRANPVERPSIGEIVSQLRLWIQQSKT